MEPSVCPRLIRALTPTRGGLLPRMEVPVLVVSTNEGQALETWLSKVSELKTRSCVAVPVVVDNASWDSTLKVVHDAVTRRILSPKNVFSTEWNRGFVSAQNKALRALVLGHSYEFFATLNIDAEPSPNWLEDLVAVAKRRGKLKIGMWGGPIYDLHHRTVISSTGHWLRADGAFLDIDRKLPANDPGRHSAARDFEPFCPCFAASLWSFDLVRDAGLPDNDQFLYYDDVELAFKARLLGWRAQYVPRAQAYHPIPNQKRTFDSQRVIQRRGQLKMVRRYLPETVAMSIFGSLSSSDRTLLAEVDSRTMQPFGTENDRQRLYDNWKERYGRV